MSRRVACECSGNLQAKGENSSSVAGYERHWFLRECCLFFRSQAHIDVTLEITSHGNGDVSHLVHSSQQVGINLNHRFYLLILPCRCPFFLDSKITHETFPNLYVRQFETEPQLISMGHEVWFTGLAGVIVSALVTCGYTFSGKTREGEERRAEKVLSYVYWQRREGPVLVTG